MLSIKKASPDDIDIIYEFIKDIARYENMLDDLKATKEILYDSLFVKKAAFVLLGFVGDEPIGHAVWHYNFSTFEGKRGIYLEDIFIKKEHRHKGYGKEFFKELIKIAKTSDCPRIDWVCLDWNEPSIKFYESIGGKMLNEWKHFRLSVDKDLSKD
ncbi:MAG: GNAT family N-acetyltransferase [Campylobacter sp.]|nr:GNAT family N-acetyltransferase [Campylobacter sp.]